jgi:hypothetical protein
MPPHPPVTTTRAPAGGPRRVGVLAVLAPVIAGADFRAPLSLKHHAFQSQRAVAPRAASVETPLALEYLPGIDVGVLGPAGEMRPG